MSASSGNSTSSAPASRARSIPRRDPRGVALEVADAGVDLRERECQRLDEAGHARQFRTPRASHSFRELAQPGVARVVGPQDAAPREGRRRPGTGPPGEDHGLSGGGDLRVERPRHLPLHALEPRAGVRGVVEDHDVAQLQRVDDLVVGERAAVAGHELGPVRAAGRRLVSRRGRRAVVGRAAVGTQLAGAVLRRSDLGVVARAEHEHEPEQRHRGDHDRQPGLPQAVLLLVVRRRAGRARPLRLVPGAGTPAAADSSSIDDRRSATRSSMSAIAS